MPPPRQGPADGAHPRHPLLPLPHHSRYVRHTWSSPLGPKQLTIGNDKCTSSRLAACVADVVGRCGALPIIQQQHRHLVAPGCAPAPATRARLTPHPSTGHLAWCTAAAPCCATPCSLIRSNNNNNNIMPFLPPCCCGSPPTHPTHPHLLDPLQKAPSAAPSRREALFGLLGAGLGVGLTTVYFKSEQRQLQSWH